MEVEIISKECIKPSSPTPHHLKTHKLSLLDLYLPPIYSPTVLYYPMNQHPTGTNIDHIVSTRLQLLKQSLSETLARFYPLAGKIIDHLSIDCNDEGIYFIEARVKSRLDVFLNLSDISLCNKFFPDDAKLSGPNPGNYVAGVQVTTFACGGIAVGALISHMIADGISFCTFLKSWAAVACKNYNEETMSPNFDASFLFPQNEAYPKNSCFTSLADSYIRYGRWTCRRFLFDGSAIAELKAKAKSSGVQNPTRVEVVTALLGKCTMAALKAKSASDKPFLMIHAINLRRKAKPLFSEYSMGNFVWWAPALCKNEEVELQDLVCQSREAIAQFNGDFVNSLQGNEGLHNILEAVKYERETYTSAADRIGFSSLCNFGLYEIDFGWGKPIWASIGVPAEPANVVLNIIVLMDTKMGNEIEAWVYLDEDDMAILQLDQQLLQFATVDPPPIKTQKRTSNFLSPL